jgi:hypothetical protein
MYRLLVPVPLFSALPVPVSGVVGVRARSLSLEFHA